MCTAAGAMDMLEDDVRFAASKEFNLIWVLFRMVMLIALVLFFTQNPVQQAGGGAKTTTKTNRVSSEECSHVVGQSSTASTVQSEST